jgi:thiol-disulfide isomerase/thioredoxin
MIKDIYDRDVISKSDGVYINQAKGTGGLLMISVNWCGHCKRTLPILKEVSEKLGSAFPIFKLDADINKKAVNTLNVDGFPTIFYIDRNGKIGKTFSGDRTIGGFLNGICDASLVCRK